MSVFLKMLLIVTGIGTVAASTYFLEQVIRTDHSFQVTSAPDETPAVSGGDEEAAEGHGAKGHEAKAEAEHGGGHEGGEGEGPRKPAEVAGVPGVPVVVSLEQTFANVQDAQKNSHSLMLKLDIELFDESNRLLVDRRDGVLKSTIIETAREQSFEQLETLGGKAYFKELLTARMNEKLQKAVVREIHFNTFYMQ